MYFMPTTIATSFQKSILKTTTDICTTKIVDFLVKRLLTVFDLIIVIDIRPRRSSPFKKCDRVRPRRTGTRL